MKKSVLKKQVVIITLILSLTLTACDVSEIGSLIEVENQTEQFDKMTEELSDLKEIRVKNIPLERYKKMRDIIYDEYFVHKSEVDKKYITEEIYEGENELRYEKGEENESLSYADGFLYWDNGNNVSDGSVIEEVPNLKIMEKEVEKLFQLLDLPLGDSDNGYMIDDLSAGEDNRGSATIKRCIERKELSTMPSVFHDLVHVENITISFTGNKVSEICMIGLTEKVSVEPFKNDVLVDDPQKAHKIVDDYIYSTISSYIVTEQGTKEKKEEKMMIDRARITYVVQSQNDGVSILYPMAEFHCKPSVGSYHIDLTTKEVIEC